MKNTILAVLAITILSGCAGFAALGRYGTDWDRQSPKYGIHYRVDATDPRKSDFDYGIRIDTALEYMAGCLGVTPQLPPDFIVVITNDLDPPADGWTYANVGIIAVTPDISKFFSVMEHEFIHALYYANYGNDDHGHTSGCYPSGTIL